MKFRTRPQPLVMGFQIAPMVDILLVLLCFFIVTWSFARKELELDVKVPTAEHAKESNPVLNQTVLDSLACSAEESNPVLNQTVLNVKVDGTVVWSHKTVPPAELVTRLKELSNLFPDY